MKIYETQQGTVIDLTTDDESAKRKDDGGPPPIVIDHLSTSGDEEEEAAQTAGPVTRSQSRQGQSKKKRSRDPQLTVELSDSEDEGKNSSSRIGTSPASQKRWKRGIQRVEEDLAAKKNGNDRSLRLKIQEEEELEKQRRELQELWQKEKERLKLERLEKECREKERLELERLEKERERLELERREQERRQNELKRLEKIRKEKERLELERLDKVRKEKERLELERLEKERKEQEARNHQKRLGEEQKAMTESSEGKATRLVEKLVSFMEEYKAKKQADIAQRIDLIAIDDLWLVAKRFFDQQDLFLSEGVSPQIILGYHYTDKENLKTICWRGLLSKSERSQKKVTEQRYTGSAFGEGIYIADGPLSSQSYGNTGLLVARLPGVSMDYQQCAREYNSGNHSITCGAENDWMVLEKTSQCLVLAQFASELASLLLPNKTQPQGSQSDLSDLPLEICQVFD